MRLSIVHGKAVSKIIYILKNLHDPKKLH
jgi:hypothetical protein